MDYRGHDLDLRTGRWSASSTDPATGWREVASQPAPTPSPRPSVPRSGPIWVDETLLACANHAYDVALAYRSAEVRLEHLLLALTRVEAAAGALEARGVRVVSLRRDSAVAIAGELSAAGEGATPRRSPELEDVLRLAAARASHLGRAGSVDDVVQVLADVGGDLPGGDLIARHFPRAAREFWGGVSASRSAQHLGTHLLDVGEGERALSIAAPQPQIDQEIVQRIFERLADIERAFSERLAAVEAAIVRQPLPSHIDLAPVESRLAAMEEALARQPLPGNVDLSPVENRLAAIEGTLQGRPVGEGVAAIDPALVDRLWAIEHALGTERTERASAVTALSDEITGVRSAVRLAAQNAEQAQTQLADQVQQLSAALAQHRLDLATSLGDRIVGIEQTLDTYDQKATETHAVYSAELAEVHDALMKISANQHTLAGAIDSWRNNGSGEMHLINARIGAVHEDGAKRLAALEKLCSDVDTLSQLVLEDRAQPRRRGSFKQWLFGTEDWIKASWRRRPIAPRSSFKWSRIGWRPWRASLKRRGNA